MNYVPPPNPPPLLTLEQLESLAIQGHLPLQLPPSLSAILTSLSSAAADFFSKSPALKSSAYPAAHGTESGYYTVEGQKEYLTLRCSSTSQPDSELEQLARQAWRAVAALLNRVISDISEALNVEDAAWEPLLEGCFDMPNGATVDETLPTLLRMFRYEPNEGIASKHTDNGLLTLCVGGGQGLQVWEKLADGGKWVDAQGPTVLVGDMLRVLSSNRICAGVHRVVGNERGRSSIVFALRPCLRHSIDLRGFGGEGIVSVKKIYDTINSRKYNINARKKTNSTPASQEVMR